MNVTSAQIPMKEIKVKTPWYQHPMMRFKAFLRRTIGHTRLYRILRTASHLEDEIKRRNSARLHLEKVTSQKKAQEAALTTPFTAAPQTCEKHGIYSVSGFPHAPCPSCLREQAPVLPETPLYVSRVPMKPIFGGAPIEVKRAGVYAGFPRATVRLTPPPAEQLPQSVRETDPNDLFLLDKIPTVKVTEVDSGLEETVKREVVRKLAS